MLSGQSLRPNLTRFSFIVINFITLLIYTPTFKLIEPCPPWVYASWGLGLLLYQAFDVIDGMMGNRLEN